MRQRGFTLIELLMVIAIIGLLSTVVLGSLKTAQQKAADSKVIQQARELRTIMELERNESGTYTAIKNGGGASGTSWWAAGATCSGFSGTYATQATQICNELVRATGNKCGNYCVYFKSVNVPTAQRPVNFTITAYLPSSNTYLCLGSSGGSSNDSPYGSGDWTYEGCYANP